MSKRKTTVNPDSFQSERPLNNPDNESNEEKKTKNREQDDYFVHS